MSRLPRWIHRSYARVFGYFWLPCPLCGVDFGGHEWRMVNGLYDSIRDPNGGRKYVAICPSCTRAGRGAS